MNSITRKTEALCLHELPKKKKHEDNYRQLSLPFLKKSGGPRSSTMNDSQHSLSQQNQGFEHMQAISKDNMAALIN